MDAQFNPRQYQDAETSQKLKELRRHCHLANEALKSINRALPNWGKTISNLDVASNQLQLFEDQLSESKMVLQKIAIPMQDVRETFRPSIPTLLDTTKDSSVVDAKFSAMEHSLFHNLSNEALEQRQLKYNKLIRDMALESLDWRDNIKEILFIKKQQEAYDESTRKAGCNGSSNPPHSSSSSSNKLIALGELQRENVRKGLDVLTYIGAPSYS